MSVKCQIRDYNILKQRLEEMEKAPRAVLKNLTADAKKRVPGWVASEVTKAYGVKKSEITGKKLGRVKVVGSSIDRVAIIYVGRRLTPMHFKMAPTVPKIGGSYTLKATIIKGQRTTLGKVKKLTKKQRKELGKNFRREGEQRSDHSPVMLMHTGNKEPGGIDYIPFQRRSTQRNDIEAIKTVSLPQMVSSERTHDGIQTAINEGLSKRLEHHMKRFLG